MLETRKVDNNKTPKLRRFT